MYLIAIVIVTKDHLCLWKGLRPSVCEADVTTIHYRNLNCKKLLSKLYVIAIVIVTKDHL